jgi:hypothetical protein
MATISTASMIKPDTIITIKFKQHGTSGLSWEGKEYGPGGQAGGFNGGDTVSLPAYFAARWIGNGRADLVDDDGDGGTTPPGTFESRDPVLRKRR